MRANEGARDGDAIRRMFGGIAPRYDLLNRLLSLARDRYWRREAVAHAQLPSGGMALDVCTGTADMALELARQFPSARAIIGVDFCLPMIRIAAEKVARKGLTDRVRVQVGSAEALPFGVDTFDAVTIAFGIRNVVDRKCGLTELCRVLRPGGVGIILEFAMPRGPLFGWLYRVYFHWGLPWLGGLISGDAQAYRYLPASVSVFPAPQELSRMMEEVGFCDVHFRTLTGGIVTLHVGKKSA
ncbi:MAG: bifunctional demethylmenaquinone methyltransferase/2-methoxy-6-polyprenyl-1,4-benzoquinol methylase UbiE [candidate division NC10 bacterium]|nr:bifunctional demethylmenaquinone methyltransferase/2-methoxy-6-polyprenyl-1,4-benzoquinol methylase UbiE [candidate division NC10 bacterium]MDE2322374.1 bifunctional demethylmenaquinone methyltransferase/2-methoxy-6-polyprenyl-1,4-benzoquinol methylase UbiE [candidate division NC10 bacterium]